MKRAFWAGLLMVVCLFLENRLNAEPMNKIVKSYEELEKVFPGEINLYDHPYEVKEAVFPEIEDGVYWINYWDPSEWTITYYTVGYYTTFYSTKKRMKWAKEQELEHERQLGRL